MKITQFRGDFAFLSNMAECTIKLGGYTFNSVEQAYQFHKTTSVKEQNRILKSTTPKESKIISKGFKYIKSDWNDIKYDIMYKLVKIKFTDNDDFKKALCLTNGIELIEGNWWGDTDWGMCNGVGQNNLGKILMKVRNEICTS